MKSVPDASGSRISPSFGVAAHPSLDDLSLLCYGARMYREFNITVPYTIPHDSHCAFGHAQPYLPKDIYWSPTQTDYSTTPPRATYMVKGHVSDEAYMLLMMKFDVGPLYDHWGERMKEREEEQRAVREEQRKKERDNGPRPLWKRILGLS